jgi:hypothetical protein
MANASAFGIELFSGFLDVSQANAARSVRFALLGPLCPVSTGVF